MSLPTSADQTQSLPPANSSSSAEAALPPASSQQALPRLDHEDHHTKAAELIQRNYRGYRQRRELAGYSTNAASKRWNEALKEAQWRNVSKPRPRPKEPNIDASTDETRKNSQAPGATSFAHQEWRKLAAIARRAGNDDSSTDDSDVDGMSQDEYSAYKERRAEARRIRMQTAQSMGLEYYLELVDEKHRYGSHLRAYHAEWKRSDTNENFFYWLDHGDGRYIEVPTCSRETLEKDQVRYLSREERALYHVKIGKDGRLRWHKNNELVSTSYEYKDSMEGIVRASEKVAVFREHVHGHRHPQQDPEHSDSSSSGSEEEGDKEGQHYVNHDLDNAKGIRKVHYISAGALLNQLLSQTTKKNTWIFVADTSFRLYIGIKQSGAFQHSSFLHGGRISAAGLIKVKNGQLRRLSPLSGHYRPPTRNFRAFVKSLKDAGTDMSRVSISRSYAVLLGLEGYMKTKKSVKKTLHDMEVKAEKVFHPDSAKEREERERDKTESAQKERDHLENIARETSHQREGESIALKLQRKFNIDDGHEK